MARTVDQNRAANEAFTSAHRTLASLLRPSGLPPVRLTPPSAQFGNAHIIPTPGNPVLMDLDAAWKAAAALKCFRCRLTGHFGQDCLTNFDVRMLTTDELEEILQDRLSQLDVAQADSPRPPKVSPEGLEDFQNDSG